MIYLFTLEIRLKKNFEIKYPKDDIFPSKTIAYVSEGSNVEDHSISLVARKQTKFTGKLLAPHDTCLIETSVGGRKLMYDKYLKWAHTWPADTRGWSAYSETVRPARKSTSAKPYSLEPASSLRTID